MSKSQESIHIQYFNITKEYAMKYGEQTILFYQVGAFFEMYGIQTREGDILHSRIEDFTQFAQLNMSAKEIDTIDGTVLMAGFRDYSLDKYIKIATANHYTAVVYTQNATNPKDIKRELYGIYSPGTYLSYDTDSSHMLSNHTVCIWLHRYSASPLGSPQFICGMASSHIFTGESTMFEYQTDFIMNPTTFDEMERYLSIILPSEVIVISHLTEKQTDQIIQFSGLKTAMIHKIILETETNAVKIEAVENCLKQKYVTHILSTFFGEESLYVCREFSTYSIATQAFCYLLHFLQEHNPNLVKRISIPSFQNTSNRLVLANHTLKQLNIIDDQTTDGKKSGRHSSVLTLLNRCCTSIGKRVFQMQVTNPVFDCDWLNQEYDITEELLKYDILHIRKQLSKIKDLEKIGRQIIARKIYPHSLFHLFESLDTIDGLISDDAIFSDPAIMRYLALSEENIALQTREVIDSIQSFFIIEKCKGLDSVTVFPENIVQRGIRPALDGLVDEYNHNLSLFHMVKKGLNQLMQSGDKKEDFIKIHETDKSGSSLQITKKRGELLKRVLAGLKPDSVTFTEDLIVQVKDIRFVKASASNDEIDFPQLTNITRKLLSLKERISEEIAQTFAMFLKTFETDHYKTLTSIIRWIGKLDVLQSKTYVAKEYCYCKPVIHSDAPQSFFDAVGLRHVLIEHIQQNEIYVKNDLRLAVDRDTPSGILIFGTNAVGKTSLIRAVGICVIMAQCGMYVPCASFAYKPYTAIFSRILGNDNIFKGLSTFAVEMSELRIILKMADENSLVLGDELCSGTETESAMSIFSTGLIELHEKRATFLFATHFHEITKYEEVRGLSGLGIKHMTVHYDPEIKGLVYDRVLKDGQGSRMYGLEVCKSLYMENAFMERAYLFRNKYFTDQTGELAFKPANYNPKKIRGRCELCETEISQEIHHLSPQRLADEKGFIDAFHKNHAGNLAALCEKCHDKIHEANVAFVKRKTTRGYKLTT
jgi:DNA mismatch repair protein MutS